MTLAYHTKLAINGLIYDDTKEKCQKLQIVFLHILSLCTWNSYSSVNPVNFLLSHFYLFVYIQNFVTKQQIQIFTKF